MNPLLIDWPNLSYDGCNVRVQTRKAGRADGNLVPRTHKLHQPRTQGNPNDCTNVRRRGRRQRETCHPAQPEIMIEIEKHSFSGIAFSGGGSFPAPLSCFFFWAMAYAGLPARRANICCTCMRVLTATTTASFVPPPSIGYSSTIPSTADAIDSRTGARLSTALRFRSWWSETVSAPRTVLSV